MEKWVYIFSSEKTDGNRFLKDLLGGKGANLAEMTSLKLPVPPGFTITTAACLSYYKNGGVIPSEVQNQVNDGIKQIEKITGNIFGDCKKPLLFSIRSGAKVSMPGMMDTILNLGLNDQTVLALAKLTQNERFAWDSYRRFIQMFSNVVLGMNSSLLESMLEDLKEAREVQDDTELSAEDFQDLVKVYKEIILQELGDSFPQDPYEQLWASIGAVFKSWNNERAKKYREINQYSDEWGTGVNVQSMVFGNMGTDSATGVVFTRNPSTGENSFFGEYLINAQGEDVVAGIRTPCPVNDESTNSSHVNTLTLKKVMPKAYGELTEIYKKLEAHYRDMQDIEFTIEKGKLYILQTRSGKRTTAAALRICVDLVAEGLITKEEALGRIRPEDLNQLLHRRLDPKSPQKILASGLPASPGAAVGRIYFSSEEVQKSSAVGIKCLLVRLETSPEDIAGMASAEGILTARGGMTSHAAVVARGMGKPCVAGCTALLIDYQNKTLKIKDKVFQEGDFLTIEGATGSIIEGNIPTIEAEITDHFSIFMKWADEIRSLQIRTNADNADDAQVALQFGAEGIGLCRTEHMFFDPERILMVREMIFATDFEERKRALEKLLPMQRGDFYNIFKTMKERPVNIRLLDPPLHEFLPVSLTEKKDLAEFLNLDLRTIEARIVGLHEVNPMLGHRGCRLGITFPEIYQMQVQAIMEAALRVDGEGIKVLPEIMIPLIFGPKELEILKKSMQEVIATLFKKQGRSIKYKIGTMIEIPRAAITAAKIAEHAEFFSFGTNDLTQTTLGLSRDDAGKFLPDYLNHKILEADPFVSIDQEGVGFLVRYASESGKKANPDLHLGICGEHGGDPRSIEFFHSLGLDYVSCSPYRVPIARLAAAQAVLKLKK